MKNIPLIFTTYLYYLSLIILLILYLFPGSIIGYILYGDLHIQPDFIKNPIGTSINHFFYFFILAFLGLIYNLKKQKFINSFFFLFFISIFLELTHFIIPNRGFELIDIVANSAGICSIYFLFVLKNKFKNEKI